MQERTSGDGSWVVGFDGSDGASAAVDWAALHADGRTASVRLVTCWRPPTFGPYPAVDEPASSPYDDSALERHAEAVVRRMADDVASRTAVDVEPVVRAGRAAHQLLDASADAALLILGRRGRGGFPGLRLGSTSSQCATHSAVPVVVVPHDRTPRRAARIVVGDDGSPNAGAAVRWALEFGATGTDIEIVTALDDEATPTDHPESPSVTRRTRPGRARDVLGAAARDADLVVVGTRGRGMISAAVLGSVSSWLLHDADIPVVVVPH